MTIELMTVNLLVVDDEPITLSIIRGGLEPQGYNVHCVESGRDAIGVIETKPVDLAILDYSLPDMCGADLYQQLRALKPDLPVVFLTAHSNLETAVSLMKSGVRDYLTKPFSLRELAERILSTLGRSLPEGKPSRDTAGKANAGWAPGGYIFSTTETMRAVDAQIKNLPRYADTTVLITGPTGTGKSAVARRIHELTWGRNGAPFVEIDCSTIPRELCESELFGHEKGAFTGAHRAKPGLFEAAGKGTAFLDEIGELDFALQAKFLRVLEARQFKRVGGQGVLPMQARIIAATNRNLPGLIQAGKFREDLYFRLNVFELWMPPLRERRGDILILANHFLEYFAEHYKKHISGFTPQAMEFLQNCDFPGNVRELRNTVERAVMRTEMTLIDFPHLVSLQRMQPPVNAPKPEPQVSKVEPPQPESARAMNLADLEESKVFEALELSKGNKSLAAQMLGLSRTAFHRRLQKYQSKRLGTTRDGVPEEV